MFLMQLFQFILDYNKSTFLLTFAKLILLLPSLDGNRETLVVWFYDLVKIANAYVCLHYTINPVKISLPLSTSGKATRDDLTMLGFIFRGGKEE